MFDCKRDLLDPLKHVQSLSSLHLLFGYPPEDQLDGLLREFGYLVSRVCPKLTRLESSSYFKEYESFEIKRFPDGIVQLIPSDV